MTVEEMLAREAIRRTMAAYNVAGDRLRDADFLAVFTADAVLELEGVEERDRFRCDGREAIAAWIGRWRDPPAGNDVPHQATFVRHHLSTCHIELTGADTARARTYFSAWTDIGPDHAGHYLDMFARQGDDWLIRHRRVRLDWRSADTLFASAVDKTR